MELPKFYTDGVTGEKASTPKTALPPQTVGDLIGIADAAEAFSRNSAAPTTLEPVAKLHVGPLDTGPFHIDPTPYGWDHLRYGDHNVVLQSDAAAIITKREETIADLLRLSEIDKRKIAELRATKFARFNNEECWIYDEQGENNLESLCCPVVVRPGFLIEQAAIIAARDAEIAMWRQEEEANVKLRAENLQLRAALVSARSQALYDAADDFESGASASASDIRANADAILSGQPDGPGEEDGPWAEGWKERVGQSVEDPRDKSDCHGPDWTERDKEHLK